MESIFPAVYGIGFKPPGDEEFVFPICTATAVSSSVLLTAAHCVVNNNKDEPATEAKKFWIVSGLPSALYDSAGTLITGSAVASADYKADRYFADLAAIKYPTGTFKNYLELSKKPGQINDEVTMVGYGFDSATKNVGRQSGKNKIYEVINESTYGPERLQFTVTILLEWFSGMYWILFPRNSTDVSGTVSGDSGGPLLLDGKFLGVLRGGTGFIAKDDKDIENDSVFTDIFHPSNRAFLEKLKVEGWDIPDVPKAEKRSE